MEATPPKVDFAPILEAELTKLKTAGHTAVAIDHLLEYLARLPAPDERGRHFEWSKTMASLQHAARIEVFKSALEAGQTALKILITINGGAAAALLAFLSNLISKQPGTPLQDRIGGAMLVYLCGMAGAGAASICRYFAHYADARASKRWLIVGEIMVPAAMVFGIASLAAFCVGGWLSYAALR